MKPSCVKQSNTYLCDFLSCGLHNTLKSKLFYDENKSDSFHSFRQCRYRPGQQPASLVIPLPPCRTGHQERRPRHLRADCLGLCRPACCTQQDGWLAPPYRCRYPHRCKAEQGCKQVCAAGAVVKDCHRGLVRGTAPLGLPVDIVQHPRIGCRSKLAEQKSWHLLIHEA